MERKGTSGMIFEYKKDGGLRVGYEDYGVDFFGGGDFECYYTFDTENTNKLCAVLKTDRDGLKKTLGEFVGESFDNKKFEALCNENTVTYSRMTYH